MKTNTFTIHGLVILLALILVGTASADIGSEAGNWEYRHNAPITSADIAASDFVYDHGYWQYAESLIEDTNDHYQFDAKETKADIAARQHRYDKETLSLVGTEAGDWEFSPASSGGKSFAESNNSNAHCSKC